MALTKITKRLQTPGPAAAEPEVRPLDHGGGSEPVDQKSIYEVGGRRPRHRLAELEHHQTFDAGGGQPLGLQGKTGDCSGRPVRPQQASRMRIESNRDALGAVSPRFLSGQVEARQVTAVDSVKVPNGNHC